MSLFGQVWWLFAGAVCCALNLLLPLGRHIRYLSCRAIFCPFIIWWAIFDTPAYFCLSHITLWYDTHPVSFFHIVLRNRPQDFSWIICATNIKPSFLWQRKVYRDHMFNLMKKQIYQWCAHRNMKLLFSPQFRLKHLPPDFKKSFVIPWMIQLAHRLGY